MGKTIVEWNILVIIIIEVAFFCYPLLDDHVGFKLIHAWNRGHACEYPFVSEHAELFILGCNNHETRLIGPCNFHKIFTFFVKSAANFIFYLVRIMFKINKKGQFFWEMEFVVVIPSLEIEYLHK